MGRLPARRATGMKMRVFEAEQLLGVGRVMSTYLIRGGAVQQFDRSNCRADLAYIFDGWKH